MLRRAVRPRRRDHRDLARQHGADLHCSPHTPELRLRVLSRPRGDGPGAEGIYTACDADAAYAALADFAGTPLGKKYPAATAVWERAWDRFTPFLAYGPALRRVLYTTNAVESFNREMRKVLKTRTQFPNDDSVAKTLWLAILDIEDKRAEQRARQAERPRDKRDSAPRLVEGHVTQGWHEAWGEMVALWPDRFADRM